MRLTLRSNPASPFGRKVKIAAELLGLSDRIETVLTYPKDDESLRASNPLGKVPALELEDGRVLYDSRVIIEFLDTIAGGGGVIPKETRARFEALRLAALADGIIDAAILIIYEARYRPDREPYEPWLDYQRGKIARSVAALAETPPDIAPVTVGTIGVACALSYLDFRGQYDWRPLHPGLVEWLDRFAAEVPAFEATMPRD